MSSRVSILLSPRVAGALAALGLAMAAAPAPAQTVEELTVTGHYGPGGEIRSLSKPVSWADLDLRTKAGHDELDRRIDLTARYLCEQLGETNTSSAVAPSCRDAAVKDAKAEARVLISQAPARPRGWVPGPAWTAPGK